MLDLLLLCTSFLVVFFVFSITKNLTYLFFSSIFVVLYIFDGIATTSRGGVYLSPAYSYIKVSIESIEFAKLMAFSVLLFYSILFLFLVFKKRATHYKIFSNCSLKSKYTHFQCRPKRLNIVALFLIFVIYFILYFVFDEIKNTSIFSILSNRGLFFDENISATLILYILPGLSVLAFYIGFHLNGVARFFRYLFIVIFVLLSVLCLLTGSRSAFLLNLLMPILVYSCYKSSFILKRINKNQLIGLFSIFIFIVFSIQISNFYRDSTRGKQNEESFFISPDVVQFDALSIIIDNKFSGINTYWSALTFVIPRSIWNNKPNSGNRVFSENFFGERLENTGAEMTSSLLGEAYINFGFYGVISSGLLLGFFTRITSLLLLNQGVYRLLGLVFLFRGINLIRGDLLNAVTPLFFTFLIFYFFVKFIQCAKH